MPPDRGPWEPLSPPEVTSLLGPTAFRWWIAGGLAIDLRLGRQTRPHEDLDVLVLREDQLMAQQVLDEWDLHAADPPGHLRPWRRGETLPAGVHDLWCRPTPDSPWAFQLMIDDATEGTWRFRRDARVQRPVEELDGPASDDARRVLAPEVQLLYKSRTPRPKDEADFLAVREYLDADRRQWLVRSLRLVSPSHHWLLAL